MKNSDREKLMREFRAGARASYLLTRQSAKTVKGEKYGILTGVLYLSPARESGVQMCRHSSPSCRRVCLGHSSGRMKFSTAERARILRTWEYLYRPDEFKARLLQEIRGMLRYARAHGMRVYIRLNGSSDINWLERFPGLFQAFPTTTFYDYTKDLKRMDRALWPDNYHCTFSRTERTSSDVVCSLAQSGYNIAVVFGGPWPEGDHWLNIPIVDGDVTDARPDDSEGVIVALTAKGAAKHDTSGFVVRI